MKHEITQTPLYQYMALFWLLPEVGPKFCKCIVSARSAEQKLNIMKENTIHKIHVGDQIHIQIIHNIITYLKFCSSSMKKFVARKCIKFFTYFSIKVVDFPRPVSRLYPIPSPGYGLRWIASGINPTITADYKAEMDFASV